MKSAVIVIAALCLVAGGSLAAQPESRRAAKAERGSDANPLSVKIIPPADAEAIAEREAEKAHQERQLVTATVWLAGITGALAIFTALLWLVTYRLMRGAQRAEAPFFFAEIQTMEGFLPPGGTAAVVYGFRNAGKSPGVIRRFRDYTIVWPGLPPAPNFQHAAWSTRAETYIPIAQGETSGILRAQAPDSLSGAQVVEKFDAGMSLFVIGEIEYEDIFNVTWVQGFCIRIRRAVVDQSTQPPRVHIAFERAGGRVFNYRKSLQSILQINQQ